MLLGKKTETITTFLGADAVIEGIIEFEGTIRLEGKVKGAIRSKNGTVIIGEGSVIDADMDVQVAIIMGKVNGFVKANDRIEIYPPGSVMGDIQAPVVCIDAGVKFNGSCAMEKKTQMAKSVMEKSREILTFEEAKIKNFPKNL